MTTKQYSILTANQAVAQIAYKTNEVFPIYPITPASEMSELVEELSAKNTPNIFGNIPSVFQMQSEAGVAGAMHGAIQTGSLSSTFTASQGLLLMLPNMFKIAGELTPNVIHVATRSIATHALSVFGDHSDIMATRQSGYAFLGSASVQEAQDFALISQAASLQSHIPFVHFFDGFRTSHETSKIKLIPEGVIHTLLDYDKIQTHNNRALNPNNPVIRGTAQGPDVYFQSREKTNLFYNSCPDIVQNKMDAFATLTGRQYKLFDYVGHPKAEHIIIAMASATETIEETIKYLNTKDEKFGLVKVRLFRPFSTKHLIEALPPTCKSIAVLDRTKEPGSTGEPLYLDVVQSMIQNIKNCKFNRFPNIVGGRYGLSSKDFTPSMVTAIIDNLKKDYPKNNFTVGINDDVTNLSLDYTKELHLSNTHFQAIFYHSKSKKIESSFENVLDIIGSKNFIQGYDEIDYKKSDAVHKFHLRLSETQIKAPYLISNADLIICDSFHIEKSDILGTIKTNGTLLINSQRNPKLLWESIASNEQYRIIEKNITVYVFNSEDLNKTYTVEDKTITSIHACFLTLKRDLAYTDELVDLMDSIHKVDTSKGYNSGTVQIDTKAFSSTLLGKLLANKGNEIPVSMLPADGTFESNTSEYNHLQNRTVMPQWNPDLCTQCGACSMACPQAALRIKAFNNDYLTNAPKGFKSIKSIEKDWELDLLNYTIQINPDQCNPCNNCIDACPTNALTQHSKSEILNSEKENWKYFETIPELDRTKIDATKVSQQQLQEPLFKYSIGVEGCGEAPYLKLMSQLFGDRLIIANATGSSSIFGGALPTTPWSKNKKGKGPAWSNSLFEDNAEFGLGFRLSLDHKENKAKQLLEQLTPQLDFDLVHDIIKAEQSNDIEIEAQRERINLLKKKLLLLNCSEAKQLLHLADNLVKQSVWIIGGDGWAYDIGFGGVDHVMASGKNVNILVLDNEIYDNTGGQTSKATPYGAEAKFSFNGKQKQKKDLGLLAMTYNDVYIASVSIGANQEQTLKAFNDAESFDGPSIIIAYCHSDSHGIDMKNPSQYHKAAVNSGQWLLYRNDPRNAEFGQNTLQLDSDEPSIKIEEYLYLEGRFKKLFNNDSFDYNALIRKLQKKVDQRYDTYLSMASSGKHLRAKLIHNNKIKKQLKH